MSQKTFQSLVVSKLLELGIMDQPDYLVLAIRAVLEAGGRPARRAWVEFTDRLGRAQARSSVIVLTE